MSIIRHIDVTLNTLISESNLIVEVSYVEPFVEEVPIDGHPAAELFLKKGLVFQVKNILKNREELTVGALIRVPYENWRRSFSQHKEIHANGVSKSYGVKTYNTSVPSMKDAQVLFLDAFHNTYDLSAAHAFEWADKKKQIEDLIRMS